MPRTPTNPRNDAFRRASRTLRWHRRPVAAAIAVLALAWLVHGLAPPPVATTAVLVAARDLAAGTAIDDADLRLVRLPAADVPASALRAGTALDARQVVLPIRAGELLTTDRLLGPDLLAAFAPGTVAAAVHLADADTGGLVRAGDRVDIIAAGESGSAWVVAPAARVLIAPSGGSGASGGVLSSTQGTGADSGAVVVLAVPSSTATALARAAVTARLSMVLRGT